MARYRQRQPPARFAPIAEHDHCQTGMAPALPGETGGIGGPCQTRTDDIPLAGRVLSQLS